MIQTYEMQITQKSTFPTQLVLQFCYSKIAFDNFITGITNSRCQWTFYPIHRNTLPQPYKTFLSCDQLQCLLIKTTSFSYPKNGLITGTCPNMNFALHSPTNNVKRISTRLSDKRSNCSTKHTLHGRSSISMIYIIFKKLEMRFTAFQ